MAGEAVLLKALPYAAKIPAGLKALYNSKHFLSLLFAAGLLGSEALSEAGKSGERKLLREKLSLETQGAKASAEASKKATIESRERAKEYTEALLKAKREERSSEREQMAMQSFMQSQDRQMALLMQALQTMSNREMGSSTQSPVGGGMLGLMRGSV